jgi:Beta-ketoacyl synthase, N-terminal domain
MKVYIEGIAWWSRNDSLCLTNWAMAQAYFLDQAAPTAPLNSKPAASLLAASERRRAPDSVALAIEVAQAACLAANREPQSLPAIFTSGFGDLAVCDQMCATLATEPLLVSPTKFHNSVHNAAVGYWTIATGCMQPSTALAAHTSSFAEGLFEALVYALAQDLPTLLVAYDIASVGPLSSVTQSHGLLACGLVLSPKLTATSQFELQVEIKSSEQSPPVLGKHDNALLQALPFYQALAKGAPASINLHRAQASELHCHLTKCHAN